ncbi:photosystem II S4 domain protein [Cyanobium sp. NIES-981]|uniref:photosystem II S4 domain protein n=1 Tax=Cyanobium sp. NIES-981 TaxID=1851505 RepID=UPI0007DDF320|nr:photosystem II S4 domain protein [Cyanobium sp. NIES-981]SBO44502.1 Photosystem II S4 domain protein [Cyanobium sp. NIES-981]
MLPRTDLLAGSHHPERLGMVIDTAERALRTWQPQWTGFLEGAVLEEAMARLGALAELELRAVGGHPGAERCRLLLRRRDAEVEPAATDAALQGLSLSGNFLFDPADPDDFRAALVRHGWPEDAIGDLWLRGDRGAQAIVAAEAPWPASGLTLEMRSVSVSCERLSLAQLQPPARRQARQLHTVEASTRLDAVASAGFGISRNRMVTLIRNGAVRLNWAVTTRPGQELQAGDRVQLSGRGELQVGTITATKRDRWRIALVRQ